MMLCNTNGLRIFGLHETEKEKEKKNNSFDTFKRGGKGSKIATFGNNLPEVLVTS